MNGHQPVTLHLLPSHPNHPPPCREPAEAMEIRVAIKASDVRGEGDRVTAAFKQWVDAGAAAAGLGGSCGCSGGGLDVA